MDSIGKEGASMRISSASGPGQWSHADEIPSIEERLQSAAQLVDPSLHDDRVPIVALLPHQHDATVA